MARTALLQTRKSLGMTQQEVADASGIQRSYYGLIETGHRNPTLKIATQIAKALNSNIEQVFSNEIFFANKCYTTKL